MIIITDMTTGRVCGDRFQIHSGWHRNMPTDRRQSGYLGSEQLEDYRFVPIGMVVSLIDEGSPSRAELVNESETLFRYG